MAMTTASLKALMPRYRLPSEVVAVSVLAIVAAVVVGSLARRQAAPLLAERDRLHAQQQELTTFRAAFQPATDAEWASRIPDSLSLSVDQDSRISLTQAVAARAELSGLRKVRVRIAGADSLSPAPSDLPDGAHLAAYTLSVEGVGGFASMLSFVRHLPLSVALQRVTAVRAEDGSTHYNVVLAVYESAGQSQHG
jgi:hypothetical protein